MIGTIIFVLCVIYLLAVSLPLLRKTEIPKPKNGWKKIEDESDGF